MARKPPPETEYPERELAVPMVECLLQYHYAGDFFGLGNLQWRWPDPLRLCEDQNTENGTNHNAVKVRLPLRMCETRIRNGQMRLMKILDPLIVLDPTAAMSRNQRVAINAVNYTRKSEYTIANPPETLHVEATAWPSLGIQLPDKVEPTPAPEPEPKKAKNDDPITV